jgi:hypothetical protein
MHRPLAVLAAILALQFSVVAEENLAGKELQSQLANTHWQWDGPFGEEIVFKDDGNVEQEGWTQRGLVTGWRAIDRRTVLFTIEKGRNRDRYAVLTFDQGVSTFEGFNFSGGSKIRPSGRIKNGPTVSVEAMPPSVVKTDPQAGDKQVDPSLAEIKVTFSKDMMTERMWSFCQISDDTFPKRAEGKEIRYLPDLRTCVLPVTLETDKTYVIWLNKGRFNSFRDRNNNPSVPYLLVFRTKGE